MSNSETLLNSGTHDGASSKALSDVQRFAKGVDLNAKIIGIEDVKQDSGDEICKTSMIKLKAVLKAAKPKVHKQKIVIRLTLDGIEIFDRINHNSLYKHSVNRISYISRDATDSRAIGYIYKGSANDYKFYAIKTENEAQEMFLALKDLFEAVLEVQKKNRTASIAAVAAAAATQKGSAVDVTSTDGQSQQTDSQIMSEVIAETNQLISGLEDKIKQMNEQPNLLDMVEEPSSPASSATIPVGTPSDRFQASIEKSLDDALASQTKSSSNDLFGVFTVDNAGLTANRPTGIDRYTALTGSLGSPAFPGQQMPNAGYYQQPQLHQQQPPHFALSALSTSPNPFQPSPLMTGQPGYFPPHASPVSPVNPFGAPAAGPYGHHQFQQQQQPMVRQQSFDPAFAAARPGMMIPQQPMRPPPVPNVPVSQSPFSDLMVSNMLSQASQAAAANKPAPAQANNNNNNSFPW